MYENYKWKYVLTLFITLLFGWALYSQKLSLGIDLQGGSEMLYRLDTSNLPGAKSDLTDTTITVLQNRLDALAIKELSIRKQGMFDIVIQVPGASQTEVDQIKKTVGTTGLLEFKLVVDTNHPDVGSEERRQAYVKSILQAKAMGSWRPYVDDSTPCDRFDVAENRRTGGYDLLENRGVSGRFLKDAYRTTDAKLAPAVGFAWNSTGRTKFYEMTSNNIHRPMAIVLDGVVQSAPVIQSAISDSGIIEGGQAGFNEDEVKRLVVILKAGALPAKPVFQYEQKVGATLGQAAVAVGGIATVLSMVLILGFMVFYYKLGGVIANVALVLNILLLLGTLAMFGATLTLPGIAGILLTAGMAVDANILIFERMREEKARGAEQKAAIEIGYDRAFWTIFDSHVTTLLTGLVLYWTGTGPIKGFAVTLIIGVSISLFTALFVTKWIYGWLGANDSLPPINFRHLIESPNFDFMAFYPKALTGSLILINIGFVVFLLRGQEKYGVDFTGGTVLEMRLKTPLEKSDVDKRVSTLVKEYDSQRVGEAVAGGTDKGTGFQIRTRNIAEQMGAKTGLGPARSGFDLLRTARAEDAPVASPQPAAVNTQQPAAVNTQQPAGANPPANGGGPNLTAERPEPGQPATEAEKAALQSQSRFRDEIARLFKDELIVAYPPVANPAPGAPYAVDQTPDGKARIKFLVNMVPLSLQSPDLTDASVAQTLKTALASYAANPVPAKTQDETLRRGIANDVANGLTAKLVGEIPGKVKTVEVTSGAVGNSPDQTNRAFDVLRTVAERNPDSTVADPFPRVDQIGGAVAKNLKAKAFIAMFFAIVAIVIYVALRFEFIWGIGAILSLAHDVFATMGFLALLDAIFSWTHIDFDAKINLPTVAAFLTLLGYSITDTIVVYDRIRERMRVNKQKHADAHTINEAINGTLSRTILTSLTVFLVAVVLFGCSFADLKVIQGFSVAMCFGVATGTYSSIFIAAPVILSDTKKLRNLVGAQIAFFVLVAIVGSMLR